jgi:hypothetical protein
MLGIQRFLVHVNLDLDDLILLIGGGLYFKVNISTPDAPMKGFQFGNLAVDVVNQLAIGIEVNGLDLDFHIICCLSSQIPFPQRPVA